MKIMNTSEVASEQIRIVVAGSAGAGKTTLAKTIKEGLGENVLVISAEAGLLSLKGSSIDFVELQRKYDDEKKLWVEIPKHDRMTRLAEIYRWLLLPETMAKYKWVFLDSISELSQNIVEQLETIEEFQGPKNTIKKFGEIATRMRSLCKSFRDLPHYSVCFSALTKEAVNQDNQPVVKISVIGAFADQLPALFDLILYLGVTDEIDASGRNVRQILTQKTPRIEFPKDRGGVLSRLEPADLSVIVNKIRTKPITSEVPKG